jgi:hypothetical protein
MRVVPNILKDHNGFIFKVKRSINVTAWIDWVYHKCRNVGGVGGVRKVWMARQ